MPLCGHATLASAAVILNSAHRILSTRHRTCGQHTTPIVCCRGISALSLPRHLLHNILSRSSSSSSKLLRYLLALTLPLCADVSAELVSLNSLGADEGNAAKEIKFHTQSGPLTVARNAVDGNMVAEDSTKIALSMSLPYIYPGDPLPSCCPSAESPVVKALCQDMKVRVHAKQC